LAESGIVVKIEGKAAQNFVDGVLAIVIDGGDFAAAEVLQD